MIFFDRSSGPFQKIFRDLCIAIETIDFQPRMRQQRIDVLLLVMVNCSQKSQQICFFPLVCRLNLVSKTSNKKFAGNIFNNRV